ncbi:hypothetical protein BDA99DRAFT_560302 [Phascolomyces articulosus]|uniref:TLC domain-containing protein n=1 Tax=Phascolomyces articulosus TaxID=60185 RepID=A0AAD5JYZ5_9FUNG|nr:hypothetical protein BDA99DRAFT_560302 [Phascolomyces articulosus]
MDNAGLVIQVSFISSFVFLIAWYSLWHFGRRSSERERSFVITLMSSFIMTSCSIPVLFHAYQAGFASLLMPESLEGYDWTLVATCFFMTSLAMDLCLGVLFYRSKINFLTGWVHHTAYLVLLTWVIHVHLNRFFVAMCILELPTLCLSFGWVFPKLRHDYLFASLYVPTRIGFHAFMIKISWPFKTEAVAALLALFPLHLYWFYGFICQQRRIRKEGSRRNSSISTTIMPDLKQPLLQSDEVSVKGPAVPVIVAAENTMDLFYEGDHQQHVRLQREQHSNGKINNYSSCRNMPGNTATTNDPSYYILPVGVTV